MKSVYLIKALNEIGNLIPGEEIQTKDLFKGYIWKRMSNQIRQTFGSEFYHYVTSEENEYPIISIGTTSSGKQKYKILNTQYQPNRVVYEDDQEDERDEGNFGYELN